MESITFPEPLHVFIFCAVLMFFPLFFVGFNVWVPPVKMIFTITANVTLLIFSLTTSFFKRTISNIFQRKILFFQKIHAQIYVLRFNPIFLVNNTTRLIYDASSLIRIFVKLSITSVISLRAVIQTKQTFNQTGMLWKFCCAKNGCK